MTHGSETTMTSAARRRGSRWASLPAIAIALLGCSTERSSPAGERSRMRWTAEATEAPSATPSAARPVLPPSVPLATSAKPPPLADEELAPFLEDKEVPVTRDAFETALLRLGACEDRGFMGGTNCQASRDLDSLRLFRVLTPGWTRAEVGVAHLRHSSMLVRAAAARDVGLEVFGPRSQMDPSSDMGRAFLGAMRSETEPGVLNAMLSSSRGGAHRSPILRELIRLALDHADSTVRSAAVSAMTTRRTYAEIADARQLIEAKLKADPADHVRGAACVGLGRAEEPEALGLIASVIDDPATPPELRGACFEGLVATWVADEEPSRPSREGYELTMKILTATPRSQHWPHNRGIMALAPMRRGNDEWAERVKDFLREQDVIAALESIALDVQAGELARDVAVFTLEMLGERDRLTKLAATLGERSGSLDRRLAQAAAKAATAR